MVAIPVNMNTTQFVMESREIEADGRRSYLGMSGIGSKCYRALWYGFHWVNAPTKLPIRTKRIFDRGDLEEARVIAELKDVGMYVYKQYEPDGEQIELFGHVGEEQEELVGFAGHAKGHPDGRVLGVIEAPKKPHLLEIKTAKASKFKEFVKHGVEKANPVYYGQMQRYMDEMGLERALFIVTNKDTEERYYERVKLNKEAAKDLKYKEVMVISSDCPPEKLSQNKNWIDCKFCRAKDVCHNGQEVDRNCRTCVHVDIVDHGLWECGKKEIVLSYDEQVVGCSDYQVGWEL